MQNKLPIIHFLVFKFLVPYFIYRKMYYPMGSYMKTGNNIYIYIVVLHITLPFLPEYESYVEQHMASMQSNSYSLTSSVPSSCINFLLGQLCSVCCASYKSQILQPQQSLILLNFQILSNFNSISFSFHQLSNLSSLLFSLHQLTQ